MKITLKLFNTTIDMFLKSYLIELVENSFVESLDDSVGLWRSYLRTGVFNFVER